MPYSLQMSGRDIHVIFLSRLDHPVKPPDPRILIKILRDPCPLLILHEIAIPDPDRQYVSDPPAGCNSTNSN